MRPSLLPGHVVWLVEVSKRDRIGQRAWPACLISVIPMLLSLMAIGGSLELSTDFAVSHS